jgi:hypothetical protein
VVPRFTKDVKSFHTSQYGVPVGVMKPSTFDEPDPSRADEALVAVEYALTKVSEAVKVMAAQKQAGETGCRY